MHWVNRGPEPSSLDAIRSDFTQGWIDWCQDKSLGRPSDRKWQLFQSDLEQVFSMLCAYCEEFTGGEVDHFQPVSKFPSLVYEWSNWVFSCPYCNGHKLAKWPQEGYVDPCTESLCERPEDYFTFSPSTWSLKPKDGLSSAQYQKASRMILDLDLNAPHHMKKREKLFEHVDYTCKQFEEGQQPDSTLDHLESMIRRDSELSSFVRVMLEERGYSIEE